ncbi:MAG: RING finger protein [Candidatus Brocadiia bacterium]|jgi:hypothetical protein
MAEADAKSDIHVLAAESSTAGKMCSICQSQIIMGERILKCPSCTLPFHKDCWIENGGCAQYGCKSAPQTAKSEPASGLASNVWGEEKPCPSCRKLIRAQAVKCRFCGASFGTSEILSADQYASREYEGQEHLRVRNKVIGLFLASLTGFLSPITVILFALLVFGKRFYGIEYRRLPQAIRALAWIGLGISGLFVLLLVLFVAFD